MNNNISKHITEFAPDIFRYKLSYNYIFMIRDEIDVERENDYYKIVGCVLNSDFTGGELVAYDPYDSNLTNEVGVLYTMDATRPHEVKPILSGYRYSLVLFLTRAQLGLINTLI